jgi:hypothetical protein
MSSRAVRKALKRLDAQKEPQQELESVNPEDVEEEDEHETRAPINPFALVASFG